MNIENEIEMTRPAQFYGLSGLDPDERMVKDDGTVIPFYFLESVLNHLLFKYDLKIKFKVVSNQVIATSRGGYRGVGSTSIEAILDLAIKFHTDTKTFN